MSFLEVLKPILLWSAALNFALLLTWFLFIAFAHDWVYRMHSKWHNITEEHFNCIHYGGMLLYKSGIFFVFICPYIAIIIAHP